MPTVIVYQYVHTGDYLGSGNGSTLYERKFEMDFLPEKEEEVFLDKAILNYVKRRYWNLDGSSSIDLIDFHIDPSEVIQPHCDGWYRRAWWTINDGDLHQLLLDNGWTVYTGEEDE